MKARACASATACMDYLLAYDYPGNIRELENMIEQGVALASQTAASCSSKTSPRRTCPRPSSRPARRPLARVLGRRGGAPAAIEAALREFDGNRERAAELLGLSPTTLWRKMKRLNILWPT
jgi:two-component system response regulator HydG